MHWLEVVISILGPGSYVPRTRIEPRHDPAESEGWVLGLVILVAVIVYVLVKLSQ